MNIKDFHQLLMSPFFMPKERAEAWRLYKGQSPEEALAFVREIEERMTSLRQSIALRETPVPYQVWGREHIDAADLQAKTALAIAQSQTHERVELSKQRSKEFKEVVRGVVALVTFGYFKI